MTCDVLILEDDLLILATLSEFLREQGYTVQEASSAAEAIAKSQEGAGPRMLVTDINLGEARTGLDVALEIRGRSPGIPVIFATGRPDFLADHALDDRQRLLTKPFKMGALMSMVRELGHRA